MVSIMPTAIISDVHANLEAFSAVLKDIDALGVTDVVSLGDFIGYGPDPEAVLEIVRQRGIHSVKGNHELGIAEPRCRSWFNPHALKALDRTKKALSPRSLEQIAAFPRVLTRPGLRFVHGCPPDEVLLYLFEPEDEDLARRMEHIPEPICFVGHTHDLERVELLDGKLRRDGLAPGQRLTLRPDARHILNIGSVGQPRDGDKRAKYALWDEATRTMELRATPYDAKTTVEKMRALNMPDTYATRLI